MEASKVYDPEVTDSEQTFRMELPTKRCKKTRVRIVAGSTPTEDYDGVNSRDCFIEAMRKSETLTDIRIRVGNEVTFQAHRVILAGACGFFYGLFNSNCVDSCKFEIELPQQDPAAFEIAMRFAYCNECVMDAVPENVCAVIEVAVFLDMKALIDAMFQLCVTEWVLTLSFPLLIMAERHSLLDVRVHVIRAIIDNFNEVYKMHKMLFERSWANELSLGSIYEILSSDVTDASEEVLFGFLQERLAVEYAQTASAESALHLYKAIRFPDITKEDLTTLINDHQNETIRRVVCESISRRYINEGPRPRHRAHHWSVLKDPCVTYLDNNVISVFDDRPTVVSVNKVVTFGVYRALFRIECDVKSSRGIGFGVVSFTKGVPDLVDNGWSIMEILPYNGAHFYSGERRVGLQHRLFSQSGSPTRTIPTSKNTTIGVHLDTNRRFVCFYVNNIRMETEIRVTDNDASFNFCFRVSRGVPSNNDPSSPISNDKVNVRCVSIVKM
jgi:hypothetical protein